MDNEANKEENVSYDMIVGGSEYDTPIQVTKLSINTEAFAKLVKQEGKDTARENVLESLTRAIDAVLSTLP